MAQKPMLRGEVGARVRVIRACGQRRERRHGRALYFFSHELFVTIKHVFPSFWGLLYLRYLVLFMIGGYGETDWPSA